MPFTSKGEVDLRFAVKARSFNMAFNGVNASVAIPEIHYIGHGSPKLYSMYELPSANNYDWSASPPFQIFEPKSAYDRYTSLPVQGLKNSAIEWTEIISTGDNVGRVASGTDYARQTSDSTDTFIAGALLGLAGGALLSAVQEFLHIMERDAHLDDGREQTA